VVAKAQPLVQAKRKERFARCFLQRVAGGVSRDLWNRFIWPLVMDFELIFETRLLYFI
jgi:hypothetical protein